MHFILFQKSENYFSLLLIIFCTNASIFKRFLIFSMIPKFFFLKFGNIVFINIFITNLKNLFTNYPKESNY